MYLEADIEPRWNNLTKELEKMYSKIVNIQSALFLIGVNELGKGYDEFTKEQKQDLIHIGNCKILSLSGYYNLEGQDKEGWPHWKMVKNIPLLSQTEQDLFIKWHIMEYFENL